MHGPASFNVELRAKGGRVLSIDPVYQFTADEIRGRIGEAKDLTVANTIENRDAYVWDDITFVDALLERRMSSMSLFLEDFARPDSDTRYVVGSLPDLAHPDNGFELVLCSHFLFTYSDQLDADFHLVSIVELLRLAPEARISPILHMDGPLTAHFGYVLETLPKHGLVPTVQRVPYEYQKGGNKMLRVRRA